MISENLIYDEEYNSLSIEAQNIFIRILAISDDFGVAPANLYSLERMINTPIGIDLASCLDEIVSSGLGTLFNYQEKPYFMFKSESFDSINSYLIGKRTKSEYLKLEKEFIESEKFSELLGNSRIIPVREYKDKSIKNKVKRIKNKELDPILLEAFERFWTAYPKKVGKGQARKAFEKINPDNELLDKILSSIDAQKASGQIDSGQFTKHPTTWLNGESWNDAIILRSNNGTQRSIGASADELAKLATERAIRAGK